MPTEYKDNLTLQQFKVIQGHRFGVNRKPMCDFILVINSNLSATVFEILKLKARQESTADAVKPARRLSMQKLVTFVIETSYSLKKT